MLGLAAREELRVIKHQTYALGFDSPAALIRAYCDQMHSANVTATRDRADRVPPSGRPT
jgi:hypothetical protein